MSGIYGDIDGDGKETKWDNLIGDGILLEEMHKRQKDINSGGGGCPTTILLIGVFVGIGITIALH